MPRRVAFFRLHSISLRQFSLRTGVLLFFLICIGFGFAARWYHGVIARADAQLRLFEHNRTKGIQSGFNIYVGFEVEKTQPWSRQLCRRWIHPDAQHRIVDFAIRGERLDQLDVADDVRRCYEIETMHLTCASMSSQFAAGVFRAPELRKLLINCDGGGKPGDDGFLLELPRAVTVEKLTLKTPTLSLSGARAIGKLPKLSELSIFACGAEELAEVALAPELRHLVIEELLGDLEYAPGGQAPRFVRDSKYAAKLKNALGRLGEHPKLESLDICGLILLNPFDLDGLCKHSKIKKLRLHNSLVNAEFLTEIVAMPCLEELFIDDEEIAPADLTPLIGATQLKVLTIGPGISPETLAELRKRLPRCKIEAF